MSGVEGRSCYDKEQLRLSARRFSTVAKREGPAGKPHPTVTVEEKRVDATVNVVANLEARHPLPAADFERHANSQRRTSGFRGERPTA